MSCAPVVSQCTDEADSGRFVPYRKERHGQRSVPIHGVCVCVCVCVCECECVWPQRTFALALAFAGNVKIVKRWDKQIAKQIIDVRLLL